jgi:hypothetical protein
MHGKENADSGSKGEQSKNQRADAATLRCDR